jgi:hypothetical protein
MVEIAHPSAGEKAGHGDLARLCPQFVTPLDLTDQLKLTESRIKLCNVRDNRRIEHARAQSPLTFVPFDGTAVGKRPRIGGIIEGSGIDQRPIEEIVAGIVRVLVRIEDIDDA